MFEFPTFLSPFTPISPPSPLQRRRSTAMNHSMISAIHLSSSWFSHNLALICGSIAFTCLFIKVIYNLFLSPLSAIPGPWYYGISDFWLTTHVLRLRQCKAIQELFEVYGPVVRVGPNKVVFRDVSTMRNVYSVHKFDKSNFYKSLLT